MAWSVLSAVNKVRSSYILHIHFDLDLLQTILAQIDCNSHIVGLVKSMDDVFSFVKETEPIKKIESHGWVIELMVQQTTECIYFIQEYAMNKSLYRSTSALHVRVSHCCVHSQGNEPLKTVSCWNLTAILNYIRTSSRNSSQLFKIIPIFRPRSLSPIFSTISIALVRDPIYYVLPL